MVLHLVVFFRLQRQKLLNHRVLCHGVNELVTHQEQTVDRTIFVSIQHGFNATDEIADEWLFTDVAHRCNDVAAVAVEKRSSLGTNQAQINFNILISPLFHRLYCGLEQVDVQTTAETAISRNHDEANALNFALLHEVMAVLGR